MSPSTPVAALSISECATSVGLGKSKLYDLIKQGRGPRAIKLDGRRLVLVEDRDAWLRDLAAQASPTAA